MRFGCVLMLMLAAGCGGPSSGSAEPPEGCPTIGYVYCTAVHFEAAPQQANFQLLGPQGDTTAFGCPGPYPPTCAPVASDSNATMSCDQVVFSLPATPGAYSLMVEPDGGAAVQVPFTTTAGPKCVPLGDWPKDLNIVLPR